MTRPSFYLDDDSSDRRLVRMLRERGFDVVAALGDAMSGADDETHLVHATANGRVLVTANQADFMRLHGRWIREGREHAGMAIIRQQRYPVAEQARRLAALGLALTAEEMRGRVEFLSQWG